MEEAVGSRNSRIVGSRAIVEEVVRATQTGGKPTEEVPTQHPQGAISVFHTDSCSSGPVGDRKSSIAPDKTEPIIIIIII